MQFYTPAPGVPRETTEMVQREEAICGEESENRAYHPTREKEHWLSRKGESQEEHWLSL